MLHEVLESGLRRMVDFVFIQEPPQNIGYRHNGYHIFRSGRTATAYRIESQWKMARRTSEVKMANGDVQCIDVSYSNFKFRFLNVYDQLKFGTNHRPTRDLDWSKLITEHTILLGDFNAHSKIWNSRCQQQRNATFWEAVVEDNGLAYVGDGQQTCFTPNTDLYSVIDLVFTNEDKQHQVKARVINNDDDSTESDHEMIEVTILEAEHIRKVRKFKAWNVDKMLNEDEERPPNERCLERNWVEITNSKPILSDSATIMDVEEEAIYIREMITSFLDQNAEEITITSRSKRWWNC